MFSGEQPKPQQPTSTPQRYFFGGSVYTGWETVPEKYKTFDATRPDPNKAAYRVFTFTWK